MGNYKEKDYQYSKEYDIFHYVTWNDDWGGEFCLWVLRKNGDGVITYDWTLRLLIPGTSPEGGLANVLEMIA